MLFYTISHSKRPFSLGKWAVMSENGPVTLRISNAQRCKTNSEVFKTTTT